MSFIRQLPTSVINKIAAGEVIERPASVVKELMENSVDAGAMRVDVVLQGGGSDLIRVTDTGHGIVPEELPLAIASHATSKIVHADDLFHVGTMGFRGEALASIAEISQFTIRSRTTESQAGAELTVDGGVRGEVVPCGCPIGTTIEVRNLFFNTPVRRKFMRTVSTEAGHATEAFTRLALAWPEVHFTLRNNERLIFDLPPVNGWQERIGAFFGEEIRQALIPVESSDSNVQLTGFVCDPQQSRGNNRMQYLFLNRRHIRDRSLQHALGEAYRGLLLHGRFPIAFLQLSMPAELVDVNVHPTKLEVRFTDSGRIYSQLLGTLRKRFLMTDLTARVREPESRGSYSTSRPAPTAFGTNTGSDPADEQRRELVAWARGALATQNDLQPQSGTTSTAAVADPAWIAAESTVEQDPQGSLELQFDIRSDDALRLIRIDRGQMLPEEGAKGRRGEEAKSEAAAITTSAWDAIPNSFPPSFASSSPNSNSSPSFPSSGFQIHNRYLVTESSEGMEVIDQHALHERILYEQFRTRILAGRLETQRLLVPEPINLAPSETAVVLDHLETLAKLGLMVEPFGGDTLLITAYPAMLHKIGPAELLRQAVEVLVSSEKQPERRDLVDEMLHMMSCKAAVKAGDPLAPEEITALLEQRHLFADTHHCPHGRPTSLIFTRDELDKRFKRI